MDKHAYMCVFVCYLWQSLHTMVKQHGQLRVASDAFFSRPLPEDKDSEK
jgi:hypothetical protein